MTTRYEAEETAREPRAEVQPLTVDSDGARLQEWFNAFATTLPEGHVPPEDPVPVSTLYRFLNETVAGGPFYPGNLPPLPPDIEFLNPDDAGDSNHMAGHKAGYSNKG